MGASYELRFEWVHNCIEVDAVFACGKQEKNVVTILEPNTVNPGLRINNPSATLGVNGLTQIINQLAKWQAENN